MIVRYRSGEPSKIHSFEVDGQALLLRFEEVYWSNEKENNEGVGYIEVDNARLVVLRM